MSAKPRNSTQQLGRRGLHRDFKAVKDSEEEKLMQSDLFPSYLH